VATLLRDRNADQRVTNIELFFDLVYVFAVTQLSHHLLGEPTIEGALQTLLLLAMVWLAWAYTTWVTNWLDPEQLAVRLLLVGLMLVSLAMSASLPRAFGDLGLMVGGAYAVMQIGRSVFAVIVLRGESLRAAPSAPPPEFKLRSNALCRTLQKLVRREDEPIDARTMAKREGNARFGLGAALPAAKSLPRSNLQRPCHAPRGGLFDRRVRDGDAALIR